MCLVLCFSGWIFVQFAHSFCPENDSQEKSTQIISLITACLWPWPSFTSTWEHYKRHSCNCYQANQQIDSQVLFLMTWQLNSTASHFSRTTVFVASGHIDCFGDFLFAPILGYLTHFNLLLRLEQIGLLHGKYSVNDLFSLSFADKWIVDKPFQ